MSANKPADADLLRLLHDSVIDHAEALARTPGATPFAVAVCLLSTAVGLLTDSNVCPPAIGRAVLDDMTTPPAPPSQRTH